MAFPTITIQPKNESINSSLYPINFTIVESTPDTLNILSQVEYWNGSAWTTWGGQMRCSPNLDFAGYYDLNIADLVNSLPKSDASGFRSLGDGGCFGGAIGQLEQIDWESVSNWKVRIQTQREYLDTGTGFIEVDSDITQSNSFYIHEGAAPFIQFSHGSSGIQESLTFGSYLMQQNTTDAANSWLWLTDNIYQANNPQHRWDYTTKIRKTEQFYLHTFNGRLLTGITLDNKLQITTFHRNGTPLGIRNVTWNFPPNNDGMQSIDVGFRSIMGAYVPNGAEGPNFDYVASYEVVNKVANAANTSLGCSSLTWVFKIDRTCRPKSYQRFMWKNQLGGFDMFSSEGKLESRRKIKRSRFERRRTRLDWKNVESYGKNNWLNKEEKTFKIETQNLRAKEAKWFSKIGASALVYLRVDLVSKDNPVAFGNFTSWENLRDSGQCNSYVPIIINSNSIKIRNTSKQFSKVSFEYQFAVSDLYPRM